MSKRFRDKGLTMVEYALGFALVSIVTLGGAALLSGDTKGVINKVASAVSNTHVGDFSGNSGSGGSGGSGGAGGGSSGGGSSGGGAGGSGGGQSQPANNPVQWTLAGAANDLGKAPLNIAWSHTLSAATDPDGDSISYTASGLPSWMTWNAAQLKLAGTPPANEAVGPVNFSITASDGKSTAKADFSLNVSRWPGNGFTWGDNSLGNLGNGTSNGSSSYPVSISGPTGPEDALTFSEVAHTSSTNCGLDGTGQVYCWGYSWPIISGQHGSVTRPVAISQPTSFTHIYGMPAGGHMCALDAAGNAYCWGDNTDYKLGVGDYNERNVPTKVAVTSNKFVKLALGDSFTCGLTQAGEVNCWGNGGYGQMGDGSNNWSNNSASTVTMPTDPRGSKIIATDLAAGGKTACILDQHGYSWCWGDNSFGQIGNGMSGQSNLTPVATHGPTGAGDAMQFASISVGNTHVCGISKSGGAYCWGKNGYGALGTGDFDSWPTTRPLAVAGSADFVKISAGVSNGCAITSVGGGFCWGSNRKGALGEGTQTDTATPTPIGAVGGVSGQELTFSQIEAGWSTIGIAQ